MENIAKASIKDLIRYSYQNKMNSKDFIVMLKNNKRFIPVYYDNLFKSFMANENNRYYLSKIISYVTGLEVNYVKDNLRFVESFNGVDYHSDKSNTSDLKIEIGNYLILIEMNINASDRVFCKNRLGLTKNYKYVS